MKLWKILILLGMYIASSESIIDVFTTSHVDQSSLRNRNKRIQPKKHFCSENKIEKQRCNKDFREACKRTQTSPQGPACGFDALGVKFDFNK